MDGGTGDGRLDLDDQGTVVEAATSLDDAPTGEVLDDGRGRSWRERLVDSGATAWARRHRLRLGAAAGLMVLAGAGAVAWTVWVPPPLDPQLRVTVTDLVASQEIDIDGNPLADGPPGVMWTGAQRGRAAYGLTPQDARDTATYAVLGIEGPAVRASTSHDHALDGSVPVAADVDAIVDCSDPASLDPAPGGYALRVARTDAWNRTLVGLVPLTDSVSSWPVTVSNMCAEQQARHGLEVREVIVRGGSGTAAAMLELGVVNRLAVAVEASSTPGGGTPPVVATIAPTRLAAGSPGRLLVRLEVRDCTTPTLYPIGVENPDVAQPAFDRAAPGTFVNLALLTRSSSATGDNPPPTATAEAVWSAEAARRIDAALRASCAGAPPAPSVRVAAVGTTSALSTEMPNGDTTADRSTLIVLRVPTAGTRVRVESPQQPPEFYVGSFILPVVADVIGGRATLVTEWAYDCSGGGYAAPPVVELRVSTPRGEFAYAATIRSAELTREILSGCEYADEQQLIDAGWPPPAPPEKRLLYRGA